MSGDGGISNVIEFIQFKLYFHTSTILHKY